MAQGGQAFFQRIRRMGKIDHDKRRFLAAHLLHTSRRSSQRSKRLDSGIPIDTVSQQNPENTQDVTDIEPADQLCPDFGVAIGRLDPEFITMGPVADIDCVQNRDVGPGAINRIPCQRHFRLQFTCQLNPHRIVEIDDLSSRTGAVWLPCTKPCHGDNRDGHA